ncbi:FAD-dependent oxidoreductase [Vibrio sp.]|nr:FAD-dependent oxidoreductase [Vibrio sp.]
MKSIIRQPVKRQARRNVMKQSIAILGAGLVGRMLALYFEKQSSLSLEVHLYEKSTLNDANSTGRIAAAMVAPTSESTKASPEIVEWGKQSLVLWPEILSTLNLSHLFHKTGSIVTAHPLDEPELMQFVTLVSDKDGLSPSLHLSDLQAIEPELGDSFQRGYFLKEEAHIDNDQLYIETENQIKSSRIRLYEGTPLNIDSITNEFDCVIDCRGLGAKYELDKESKRLRGVRGEIIKVHAPEVSLTHPVRIMHPRQSIYIVPKPHHHFTIGATEIESEDKRKPTMRSVLELLSAAYQVNTGFAEAEIVECRSGLRPTLLDNKPIVEKSRQHSNVIMVNGLYRHGYLLLPVLYHKAIALVEYVLCRQLLPESQ